MNETGLTIERARWCDEVRQVLMPSVRRAPCFRVEDYGRMLLNDPVNTLLFSVHEGGALVGHFILRIEHFSGGSEGVILAAAGKRRGHDLTAELLPLLEARFKNVHAFRISTARPGLVRKLQSQGYALTHYTLRKPAHAS